MVSYAKPLKVWTPPTNWNHDGINLPIAVMAQTLVLSGPGPSFTVSPHMLVQVDTGSQGCVINVANLYQGGNYKVTRDAKGHPATITGELLPGVTYLGTGQIVYSSSGKGDYGFYYEVALLGLGVGENGHAAALVQNAVVLGAVPADVNGSHSGVPTTGPLMMGVGFGRPNMGTNTFVNAVTPSGDALYPSYQIAADGITLGIQPSDLPSGFKFQKLGANTDPKGTPLANDSGLNPGLFATPQGTITITPTGSSSDGKPFNASVLIDTGINFMMMGNGNDVVKLGTYTITISSTVDNKLDALRPALKYHFEATGRDTSGRAAQYPGALATNYGTGTNETPLAPSFVAPRAQENWVNTGIHVLQGWQLYADAQVGQMAFAPVAG